MAIWLRILQLPMEYYDITILEKVGRKIGKLVKIDTCTSSALRGRYARIYDQVPVEKILKTTIAIENHHQDIVYEGEGILCKVCRRLGHIVGSCPHIISQKATEMETSTMNSTRKDIPSEWKTVHFKKEKKTF